MPLGSRVCTSLLVLVFTWFCTGTTHKAQEQAQELVCRYVCQSILCTVEWRLYSAQCIVQAVETDRSFASSLRPRLHYHYRFAKPEAVVARMGSFSLSPDTRLSLSTNCAEARAGAKAEAEANAKGNTEYRYRQRQSESLLRRPLISGGTCVCRCLAVWLCALTVLVLVPSASPLFRQEQERRLRQQ